MQLAHAPLAEVDAPALRAGAVPLRLVPVSSDLPQPDPASRYGEGRRFNLPCILLIAGLHVAVLAALMMLDVVHVTPRKASELKVIDIVELEPPPLVQAPPPPPQAQAQPPAPAVTPVVAPPPIVATPVVSAPIVSVPAPAPVTETVIAPAAPAPSAAIAAPIVPPNGSAKSLNNPAPRYPTESRRLKEQGTVRLRVVITTDGRVKEISVARSSGHERLDEAALEAVRRWRFLPGTQAGEPVEAVGFLNIPFQLKS